MSVRSSWTIRAAAFVVMLATATMPANALACALMVTELPSQLAIDFDPFAATPAPGTIRFALRNDDAATCQFDVAIVDPNRRPGRTWPVADTGISLDFGPSLGAGATLVPSGDGLWRAQIAAGSVATYAFEALSRFEGLPPAGRITVPLSLELRHPGTNVLIVSGMPFNAVINSPPKAQMNVAGANGTFGLPNVTSLDLGDLSHGANRQLFLQLRSNTALGRVTITSQNTGRLVRGKDNKVETVLHAIDYHLMLDGSEVPMASEYQRAIGLPRSMAGRSLSMDFSVAQREVVPAGTYSDLLTIDFSPL